MLIKELIEVPFILKMRKTRLPDVEVEPEV